MSESKATKWFPDERLSQIYNKGLEYAFFNADNEQCHTFAYCKDFLQDAVWATLNKKKASIHLFSYEFGKNPPLDMETMRMGVRNKGDKEFADKCEKSLKFMHAMEADMGFQPSEMYSVGKYEGGDDEVFVYASDVRWMYSPVLISLYSLALRVGMTYEEGSWREHFESAKSYLGSNDKSYTASAKKALDKIVGKDVGEVFAATLEENYPENCDMTGMHHYSGIVSFANGKMSDAVTKNWSKD